MPRPFADRSGDAALLSLFTVEDYPSIAIMNGWQGTVRTRLSISTEGRVTSCQIVKSSGSPILDASTCRLFTSRARFIPATDENGKPVVSAYDAPPIRWKLSR